MGSCSLALPGKKRVSVQILSYLSSLLVCRDGTQPRIEFPSAFYHVMARGNRRESIFHDDDGRRFFLSTLSEAWAMTGWRVHTWVLMANTLTFSSKLLSPTGSPE